MCRSLRILCAAPTQDGLTELRCACVDARWELVGGAASIEALEGQIGECRPDVVVLDAGLGVGALHAVRRARPGARVVSWGPLPGADAEAAFPDDLPAAILGLPRPGGPVRT